MANKADDRNGKVFRHAATALKGVYQGIQLRKLKGSRLKTIEPTEQKRDAGVKHLIAGVRVDPGVELCLLCHIAAFRASAHDDQVFNQTFQVRMLPEREGQVGQRAESQNFEIPLLLDGSFVDSLPRRQRVRRRFRGFAQSAEAVIPMDRCDAPGGKNQWTIRSS